MADCSGVTQKHPKAGAAMWIMEGHGQMSNSGWGQSPEKFLLFIDTTKYRSKLTRNNLLL